MNDSHMNRASRLDDALSQKGDLRHDDELRPFVETARALQRDAEAPVAPRDPVAAKNQRIRLLNMATSSNNAPTPAPAPSAPTPSRKPLPMWVGGFATVLTVVALILAVTLQGPTNVFRAPSSESIARLVIPAAHAGDAFALVAESQDAAGAATDTTFKVTSKVDVSADDLKQSLTVVPSVPVAVEDLGGGEFRVRPETDLQPGEVYRLAVNTAVADDDGSLTARPFSWAVQTKDVFRVLSSVPGDGSNAVPRNTAIEVTMSQSGWEGATSSFSISPSVPGHFETHGRSLSFIPAKPLAPAQLYTVTYKKGWKVAGSDLALQEDAVIRFETASEFPQNPYDVVRIEPSGTLFETAPGKEAYIQAYLANRLDLKGEIEVIGYALDKPTAATFIEQLTNIPWWASETRKKSEMYAALAKTQAFRANATLEGDGYPSYLRLPGVPAGMYLVKVNPSAVEGATAESSWFVLQATEIATYSISDEKTTLFWTMNIATGQPLSGATVRVQGASAVTGNDGIGRIATPAEFVNADEPKMLVADITSGPLSALVPLERGGRMIPFFAREASMSMAHDTTWGYLFADRPLYRVSDTLSFSGFAQDRESEQGASGLTVALRRNAFIHYGGYTEKMYVEVPVTADASGFFRGTLSWDVLSPGYYSVVVKRDGKEVVARGIEIRDVVKPAYSIDVLPKKTTIYAGDAIEGQIKATLFDGSPMVRQAIKVRLSGGSDNEERTLTTDDSGFADFRFETKRQACNLNDKYSYCSDAWTNVISASPVDAEEAQIQGSAYVAVWAARVSTSVETKIEGERATVSFSVRRVDISKAEGREPTTVLTQPVGGIKLAGRVLQQEWKRFEDGTMYDYTEKKVVPRYRYDLVETDAGSFSLTTDASGRATHVLPVKESMTYRLVVTATDETGATSSLVSSFSKGWVDQGYDDQSIRLDSTVTEDDHAYAEDETVSVAFFKKAEKLPDADRPTYLFLEASRGIRAVSVTNRSGYSFRYREELVPNVTLYGVVFGPNGFTETNYWANVETASKKLKVIVTPDASSYAPGAKVTASVDVRTQDGSPVSGAHVTLAAVDEALLAAASGDYEEQPIDTLYRGVDAGILLTRSSHEALTEKFGPGGAEMGGGGAEPIRRNFKDTAAFDVAITDRGGRATVSFTAPDNVTTWRLTSVALTEHRMAGAARGKAVVTKPVFVDAVIPQTLLASDKPILKLRAFGTGLKAGEAVTLTVDAPTLGINAQTVSGTAGTALSLAVERLVPGTHAVVIRVKASGGTDAIERKVNVLVSRFSHDEAVTTELAPGVALPDVGDAPEMDVTLMPLGRSRYLNQVEMLTNAGSARLESKLAARLATKLLAEAYGKTDLPAVESLLGYQRPSGGLAPLPYASEDVELSAMVAAIDATSVDRNSLANYFWGIVDNERVSREEATHALLGLAALGEPVLPRVQAMAEQMDLDWRERLAVIRALDASGDRERARSLLEAMLKDAKTTDGLTYLPVAEDQRSILEATARAATLAAGMGLPQASGLDAYVSANWDDDAFTILDRAAYLARIVPTLLGGDVTIRYAVNGKETSVTLTDGRTELVTLTNAEAKSFRIVSANGPAAAAFTRRVAGRMPTSSDVSLTRSYAVENASLDALAEGQTVNVTLSPSWKPAAQDGCYVVRDRLPSGLAPLVSFYGPYGYDGVSSYPFDVSNGEVSFVTCKGDTQPIRYRARVVSRGTYTAEAASLQSMTAPSVAALSSDTVITIK
jgi:uncharacterized protein YfaS (alpha-2-macroglobulin family)